MSDIFAADDRVAGDVAAIKLLQARYGADAETVARFEREARVTQELRHPNIVTLRGHGLYEGLPFLAMERLEGESLEAHMARGPLSHDALAAVALQAASALDAAHARGVVHRDVKPDNLFVLKGDGPLRIKMLDFGFAKITDRFGQDGLRTAGNALLGSPLYMAPEQIRATREVTAQADLWSLAVVLYELVTGDAPFGARNMTELLVQVLTAPIAMPSQRRPGLPVALDEWCRRALDRDPRRRFATATELAEAFTAALRSQPNERPARAETPTLRLAVPRARHRWAATALGVTLALGLAAALLCR